MRSAQLPRDELVVLPHVLEGVFGHEALQVSVLLNDMRRLQVVNVGALHAESNKDLSSHIESTPALYRERDTLVLSPELVTHLLEADLLDDL